LPHLRDLGGRSRARESRSEANGNGALWSAEFPPQVVAGFAAENHLATLVAVKTAGRLTGASSFKLAHGYPVALLVASDLDIHKRLLEKSFVGFYLVTTGFSRAQPCLQ